MPMYYWLAVHILYFNTAGDLKQWKVSDLFAVDPKLVVKEALAQIGRASCRERV